MRYKKGYKYKLEDNLYYRPTKVLLGEKIKINSPYINYIDEELEIKEGYAWDGASFAIDTDTFMIGALVHDALYQLIREGYLDKKYRKACDEELIDKCKRDGMCWLRRKYVYLGVRLFGKSAIKPRKVYSL